MSKSAAPLPLAFPAPDPFSLPRQRPLRLAANCRSSIPSQGPWNKILTFFVKLVLIAPMKFMPFVSLLYWLIKYLKNRGNLRYALLTSNFGQILQRLLLIVRGVGAGEQVQNADSMIDWGAIRELPDVAEDEDEFLGDGWSGGGSGDYSNYAGSGGNRKVLFLHRVQRSLSSAGDGYVDFLNVVGSFVEDSIFRLPGFVRNRLSVTTLKQLQSAFNAYTMVEVVFLFYQKYQLYKMNKAKVYQPQVPIEESLVQLEQELEAVDDLQLGHLLLQGQKLELESKKEARENLLEQKAKLQKLVAKVESRFLQLLPNSGQGGGEEKEPESTSSSRAGAGVGGALTVKQQPAQSTSSDRDSDDSDGRASVDAGDDSPAGNAVNNGGSLLTAVSPKGIHDAASSLVATGLASVASMSSFAVMTSAALHQRKLRLGAGGVSGAKLVATSPAPSSSGKLTSSRPGLRRQSTARTIESALREGVGSNPAIESADGDQSLILPPTPAASLARIVITDDEETSCGDAGEGASSGHNGSAPQLQPHRRLNSLVLASADAEGLSERAIEPMEVLRPLLFQGWFRYKKNVTRNSDLRSFRRKLYDVEKYPHENLYNFFRHLYNFLFKMKMTWCPSLRTAIYNWTLGLLPPDGDEEIVELYDIGRENLREWLAWGFLNVEYHYVSHLQNGGGTTHGYNGKIAPSSLANTPRGGGAIEDNNYKNFYNYHLEPPTSAGAASQSVTNVSMSRFTRDHLMMTSTMISRIEQWMGHKFRPGYNEELVSMRLTMDPVQAETRSVLAYLLTQFLIPTVGHNIIVHLFGFAEGVSGTMSYYFRKPSSSAAASGSGSRSAEEHQHEDERENNNKASTSTDPAGPPLVFCHGLGMGPFVYVQFIYELIKAYPDRDIFVIFVPQISCRISDANIASAREMVSCIADMLAHHYSEFNLWDTFERRRYLHDDLELSESESEEEEEEFLSDEGATAKKAFREDEGAPAAPGTRSRRLSSTSGNLPARRTSTERNVQRLESVRMDRLRSRFHRPSIFVDPLDRNPNPETAAEAHVLHPPDAKRAPPRPSSAGAAPPSTQSSKKRRFPHGAHFIGHSFGTFVMSWVIRRRPDLVAYATFVDPVCFRLFSPDLAYNMVYREPPTWIQAGIQYGVARELHVAQSLRRRLFWQQWILWPEKLKFPTNVVLSGLDSMIPAHSIRTHLVAINELRRLKREELLAKKSRAAGAAGRRGKEVLDVSGEEGEPRLGEQSLFSLAEKRKLARISVLWFPHLGHGEFMARPKAKPALEEIIARVGRIERENPYD